MYGVPYKSKEGKYETRLPSNSLIVKVPFFLVFSFNKDPPKQKGIRELLGDLETIPKNQT